MSRRTGERGREPGMTDVLTFSIGDEVVHPRRPEWGKGIVRQAAAILHSGVRAQRLTVDFVNKGRAIINTAVAPLIAKGNTSAMSSITSNTASSGSTRGASGGLSEGTPGGSGGWLAQLERQASGRSEQHELWELPDSMTDPFLSDKQRLINTLESYRFSTEPRALLEWAVQQTGLDDPLTKYTRQQLEQAFPRFERDRNNHLKDLYFGLKRAAQMQTIREAAREVRNPKGRAAIQKLMKH